MKLKHITSQKIFLILISFLQLSCSEAPIITALGVNNLDSPSSIVLVPGTNLAIVANANVNLDQKSGSLIAVNLTSNKLLKDTSFEIPNFAGNIFIDSVRKRLYIPDHDNALLIYKYQVPGANGEAISFSKINVSVPVDEVRPNGIKTDDGPAQALMIPGTSLGDLILVTNQQGTVSMIQAATLKYKDMDLEKKYVGLRLFSSYNFQNEKNFPGRGANRMKLSSTSGLVYVTSTTNNQIYVLNPDNQTIEAMIDLDQIALPTVGTRDIAIDEANQIAYIAHGGLDSIIMVDISGITKNGIPFEVVAPPILDIIPVGDGPEDIALLSSGLNLFVSNQNEDSIYMVDTTLRQVTKKVFLDKAKNPGRMLLDEPNNKLYSLDFYSNSISIFNATTGIPLGSIE